MATAARFLEEVSPSATPATKIHRGGVEVIEQWADQWRSLCDDAVDDQPFYRPEWIAAHVRAFTPEAKVRLLTVTIQGRLVALLPLLEERAIFCGIPVRRLRAPVNGHSCRFDAVLRRGPEGEVAVKSLWDQLKATPGWDLLELEAVPTGGTISALAGIAKQDRFQAAEIAMSPNPYIRIPKDLASRRALPPNKKLRSQLGTIRCKLANHGELKLRRISRADCAALQGFYHFEAAGWKGLEKTAIASSPQRVRFYDEITRWAEQFGYLSMYLLELNDEVLAAHFGLSYKGRYFSPKVTYAENFGQWAPGHLIVDEILRDCVERGIHEYDITGQNDSWKRKWTDQTRGQCTQYIFSKGFSGKLACFARFRARPWLRDALNPWLRRRAGTR